MTCRPVARLASGLFLALVAGLASAEPATRFQAELGREGMRLTSDVNLDFGNYALQLGATSNGLPETGGMSDFHVIASRRISPLFRFGLEAQISNDDALDGARAAYAVRALATRGSRSLDLRLGVIDGGAPGALFYTVKVSEDWGPNLRATGRLHRYSTKDEDLDYYAIGLDGAYDLGDGLHARAGGVYRLSDDLTEEGSFAHIGLGLRPHEAVTLSADLVGRDMNGDPGLSAELTVTIATGQVHFSTDVFGQSLATYGH
ncbi:hypothetical protein JQU17_01720 [Ponticoccus sp. SC2-23]|uniref:hypothetical protein n=1 Tax=Alexandriicola marinus TaxID=2081710 RepID=UPI000FD6C3C2|nr:hypothetical protein [Alexandriicola marinus]MBM1218900.1 hypothetical protein [Ponticoccus sp. SC6-9]MBM1224028.1 hypothetical protein [Ponticoccus sp. SC6-15]MBM1230193.1 hypothetical protein [Ponticoccus sp. SC6-38]MBM1232994.1 hypothetical protein [Ponticoccus sp. SC6-45]MBM1237056.1 hypothetical protein [Ponticoccus sp. SC6-49]MBM1242005.1 hypothetical protein [Ponticoccus sp. SC2-64]MBM1246518.1 hypothetical protein [Ponticoccus sp. SC6-42]MBM1250996.1 hypothetical protein [Pontico